jgi:hypothetical protein
MLTNQQVLDIYCGIHNIGDSKGPVPIFELLQDNFIIFCLMNS